MPWCPKCKTEFRENVSVCVDCGTELVMEQPDECEYTVLCTLETEAIAKKLLKYFEYSGIDSYYEYNEKELGYSVFVKEEEEKKAKKSFQAFYSVELEAMSHEESNHDEVTEPMNSTLEDTNVESMEDAFEASIEDAFEDEWQESSMNTSYDTSIPSEEQKAKITKMMYEGGAYEKKEDKAKDLKATATTFFFFGIIGIAFVLLNLFGVINFIGGSLQYFIMIAMFLGFILVGINSIQRFKKLTQEAIDEVKTTKEIMDFLDSNATNEVIEAFKDSSFSEEGNFIRVMEGLKALIVKNFGELDDSYLDYVTEDFYNSRFEDDADDFKE